MGGASPYLVRKVLRFLQTNPGRTVPELNRLMSTSDRSLFGVALRRLRESCQVRVDEDGRIWPT